MTMNVWVSLIQAQLILEESAVKYVSTQCMVESKFAMSEMVESGRKVGLCCQRLSSCV